MGTGTPCGVGMTSGTAAGEGDDASGARVIGKIIS
jgi:hypothetical protein